VTKIEKFKRIIATPNQVEEQQ